MSGLVPNKVVVFRWMSHRHALLARFLRRFGFEVYFLEPVKACRDPQTMLRFQEYGLRWLQFSELPDYDPYAQYKLLSRCSLALLHEMYPPASLAAIAQSFPLMAKREQKIRIVLHEAISQAIQPFVQALAVAEYFSARGAQAWTFFSPGPAASRLFGRHTPVRNLCPWVLGTVFNAAGQILERLKKKQASTKPAVETSSGELNSAAPVDAEVLYFPHQGLAFGDLFEKKQYYSSDPQSPLHQSRICHVELWDMFAPPLQREIAASYERRNVPFLRLTAGSTVRSWRAFWTFRQSLAASMGWLADLYAYLTLRRFERAVSSLKQFSHAKLALLGYDHLFPKMMCFALQSRGIEVVASQERFILTFHDTFNALLSRYYVIGEVAKKRFSANPLCCIDEIVVIGDVRTDQIARFIGGPRPKQMDSGRFRHFCLLLDFHSVRDPFINALLPPNNWASNLVFYKDALKLADEFPDVFFVIRSKDLEWCELDVFADVVAAVSTRHNITISRDYDRFDESNRLAAVADSMIARHTSLGDQMLAFGKPVLFHEVLANSDRCISWVHDYAPWPLLTHSYEELAEGLRKIVAKGHNMTPLQAGSLADAYYNGKPDGRVTERLVERLSDLVLERSIPKPALSLPEAC